MKEPHVSGEAWSVSSISHESVPGSIHGHRGTAACVSSPQVQTGVTTGGSCPREGSAEAETLLGEEEHYQNNTTTAPAPSSSPGVGCTRNCWEAAEPTCEKRLLRKKYSSEIDFREESINAAQSQMRDHIYMCEIVPLILWECILCISRAHTAIQAVFSVGNWFNQFTEILKHKLRSFGNLFFFFHLTFNWILCKEGKKINSDFCPLAAHL